MGNQEEIYRVKELGDIIHNSVDVYGLDYSDLRSKYPARIVIGKDAAVAVERALQGHSDFNRRARRDRRRKT